MTSTEILDQHPSILDLPDHLLNDIASSLNEKQSCSMEIASKILQTVLSKPSSDSKGQLQIEALLWIKEHSRLEASRWLQKRIKRHCFIECKFCECILGSESSHHGMTTSCVMPSLLPSLLAACWPSTGLGLRIELFQGESFLALVSSSIALGAGLSSFSAKVKQHLTELTITVDHKNRKAQPLEGLCMLTALQTLRLDSGCIDWSGETLNLKLPRLCSLHMTKFKQGGLVLKCPSLAEARFEGTSSLWIKVEEAALTSLVLFRCTEAQFALRSAVDQLENLETLRIELGSEVGRHLIEDIGLMRRLQELVYHDIPIARIPRRFPQRLQTMGLYSFDWFQDGAKPRVALAARLVHDCKSWDDRTPRRRPELLPIDSLDYVQLAAFEGILMCTTARGMEAKGILLTDTSEESYVIGVHGPLRSCGKGKLLELHVPRRGTDHGGNHMV